MKMLGRHKIFNIFYRESNKEFRRSGVHPFKFEVPQDAERMKISAKFVNADIGEANAEADVYAAKSPKGRGKASKESYIKVSRISFVNYF